MPTHAIPRTDAQAHPRPENILSPDCTSTHHAITAKPGFMRSPDQLASDILTVVACMIPHDRGPPRIGLGRRHRPGYRMEPGLSEIPATRHSEAPHANEANDSPPDVAPREARRSAALRLRAVETRIHTHILRRVGRGGNALFRDRYRDPSEPGPFGFHLWSVQVPSYGPFGFHLWSLRAPVGGREDPKRTPGSGDVPRRPRGNHDPGSSPAQEAGSRTR